MLSIVREKTEAQDDTKKDLKLHSLGRPSRVENATFPPVRGEMSENSEVQRARSSPTTCSLGIEDRGEIW